MNYKLTDDGVPVQVDDVLEWARWIETANRHVADTTLADGTRISTVFLGTDHSFGSGPPVLWETMIFGGLHDGWQDRYTSVDKARAGHEHAIAIAEGKAEP